MEADVSQSLQHEPWYQDPPEVSLGATLKCPVNELAGIAESPLPPMEEATAELLSFTGQ